MTNTMRHSGIPWIGDIPSHWEVKLIKWIMRNKSIKGCPTEQVLSLYREYGVVPKDSRNDNHNVTSEDTSTYKFVDVGDFVINKMKAWQGSMAVSDYQGIISPAYYICEFITENISKRYIHYLLRNETYKAEYLRLSTGLRVGQWDLNIDDFLHIPIVVPPLTEQKAIADYLDKHCAEVEGMVSLQEKIIEELRAYRQAIITETVTRGLNPNAPMKDSGVEWIGQIPEGWVIERLKNDSVFINGYAFNSDSFTINDGIKVIRIGDISSSIDYDNCAKSVETDDSLDVYLIKENDILIAMSGATTGKSCLAKNVQKAYINQRVGIIRSKLYYFVSYVLQASYIFEYINLNNAGSAQPNISGQAIGNIPIPVPPLTEQQAIADFLDKKCREIDQLIAIKLQKIEELKEYKKSLIYEYVTGKKQI